ncbi:hypothetical protein BU17DRAFT_102620 [Hysterangium stoloniferum]|nr:hypothetical protein BU17DRAFT_102620 [Hysterangium stoloniferum]
MRAYTLEEFILHAMDYENEGDVDFIKFILTGEDTMSGELAVVDPICNPLTLDHGIIANRDYDSLIGITQNIIVPLSITVYPVSNPMESLSTSIHFKYPIADGNKMRSIDYHKIPNLHFGSWGTRHMIHIFFPHLATAGHQSPKMTKEEKVIFYQKGLGPAIEDSLPQHSSDWPSTYNTEMFRACKHSGYLSYQSKMLPQYIVSTIGDKIRNQLELNEIEWGHDIFFMHTVQGIKHSTQHSLDLVSAEMALEEFLIEANLPPYILDEEWREGQWWIDVGVEFSSERKDCLQWSTLSHFHMIKEILQISEDHASRITTLGSSKYSRDIVSHLPSVSGCRIEPGVQGQGAFQAAYFQLYTTDKALTYNPEGTHHGKTIMMKEVMGATQLPRFIEGLLGTYNMAGEMNSSNGLVEVRVPAVHATTVL